MLLLVSISNVYMGILMMVCKRLSIIFLPFLVAVCFSFISTQSHAQQFTSWQQEPHSKIRLAVATRQGETAYITTEVELEKGWKIYWREAGDAGFPTSIALESDEIVEQKMLWPYPKRSITEQGGIRLESYVYEENVKFPALILLKDGGAAFNVKAKVEYGICKEICIPVQTELALAVDPSKSSKVDVAYMKDTLTPIPSLNGANGFFIDPESISIESLENEIFLHVELASEEGFMSDADVFVDGVENFGFFAPNIEKINEQRRRYTFPVKAFVASDDLTNQLITITAVNNAQAVEYSYILPLLSAVKVVSDSVKAEKKLPELSIFWVILFAFIGGFILNIMPCVLPVLSIKLLGMMRHHNDFNPHIVRLNFLSAASGIVASFLVLALLVIGLKFFGVAVGWGFHFQQPYFIIIMVLILTLFACNMWGMYEFKLSSFIGTKAGVLSQKEGLLGHFLTGVLATLLATPCTAPFLGTAVGFALSQGTIHILVAFLSMGLGLAAPYLVVSFKPTLVSWLPKPGRWMLWVKAVLGVFLLITAFWLVWVIAEQLGVNGAKALGVCIAIIIISLIPGFWKSSKMRGFMVLGAMLCALSLPQGYYVGKKEEASSQSAHSFWKPFDEESISSLVASNKVVFVDVTADWCLTCKFNELWAFNADSVKLRMQEEDVVAMRADWTNRNEQILSFLQKHQRQGIPFNIVYSKKHPEGVVLPELLTEKIILEALEDARHP